MVAISLRPRVMKHFPTNLLKTLRLRQNGHNFTDIFKWIFLNENLWISLKTSRNFVPKGPLDNNSLVQIMAWRRSGDKPLSESIMVSLLTHIYASLGLDELSHMFSSISNTQVLDQLVWIRYSCRPRRAIFGWVLENGECVGRRRNIETHYWRLTSVFSSWNSCTVDRIQADRFVLSHKEPWIGNIDLVAIYSTTNPVPYV